jgi:hypothetical protein
MCKHCDKNLANDINFFGNVNISKNILVCFDCTTLLVAC